MSQPTIKESTMAKHTHTKLIDDLDGGQAAETVTFALDGATFEIDLSARNAAKLRQTLKRYIERAQRDPTRPQRGNRRNPTTTTGADQSQTIRAWARRKGFEVASRGRIKREIVDAYRARRRPVANTEPVPPADATIVPAGRGGVQPDGPLGNRLANRKLKG
jgi:hypothetical protein